MENSAKLTFEVDLPGGEDRLREMVLYVSGKCQKAPRFGKVKLNKILWRADTSSFKERQVPVTGHAYEKLAAGPAPLNIDDIVNGMIDGELIRINEIEVGGDYIEHRLVPLKQPELRLFSAEDIAFVDESIKFYWFKSATNASELSHKMAWNVCNFTEVMPYESVFLSDEKLTSPEKEKLHALARARGWKSL